MLPQSPCSQTCSPVAHPAIAQLHPTESPEGTGLVSVGPRPLLLSSFRNATPCPADSSTSRPSSLLSTAQATRRPTALSARWSSYTPPLSPIPSFPSSLTAEVEMLKAQLAASEAMVKLLTKEKWEAVDATRRLVAEWQTALAELNKLKASALDEDDATPVVAPPSEGVWFAGSTEQPPVKNLESESASCGPSVEPKDPQDQQTQGSKEKDEETPVVSPSSEAVQVSVAGSTKKLQVPEIRITPPAPEDADSERVADSSPFSASTTSFQLYDYLSPTACRDSHPRARSRSRQYGNASRQPQFTPPPVKPETAYSGTPRSTPSHRTSFNALGLRLRVPHPIRWLRARGERDLIDLEDPLSESPARKVLNARMRVLQAQANGPVANRPSFDVASAADLEASMVRVSMLTNRPRTEKSSANVLASNPPQVQISPDFLRGGSANEIGGESQTSFWSLGRASRRRSASDRAPATVDLHAAVRSSPRGLFAPSSSRQVATPEEAGEPQPTKNTGLRRLLKKGRSVISRFV